MKPWLCLAAFASFLYPLSHLQAGDAKPLDVRMVLPEGDGGKHWPRWRGPSGQGIVNDGLTYPDQWSDKDNVLWKVKLPGDGNSSPIVWGDKIFLTVYYDKGKRRSILCLNRTDGAKLWETFAPEATPEGAYGKNGWASGTPTTDGQRVYAYLGNHGVLAVDFKGEQAWHVSLGQLNAFHGVGGSPLLYKDKVIVFQEINSKTGSFIAAFDRASGKELWKMPRKEKVGWGSPVAISVNGQDQIIVSSEFMVYGYDPETGKELWTCAGNLVEVAPTPVAGLGHLYCASGRAGPTLAIRPDGKGDITKTHVSWKTIKGSPFIPSPLLYGDCLYTVNDMASVVSCLDARTGKQHWQERCGEVVAQGFSASPIGVNGKVFFTNDAGETYVFKGGAKLDLLHVNRLGERTLASPALVDGKWYIRGERHLWCIGKK